MADISLSKAVRANLNSLTSTASMMAETQNRLSTGNKVNSALDNPSNWFTAKGLNNRAGDLNQLLDGMANGIQTLKAADNGLSAMTKTLESMQSTLRQARQDKSFQTQSIDVSKTATGSIGFKDGAVGTNERSVALQNTALTATALGMNAAITGGVTGTADTAATAGAATVTLGGTPGTLLGADTIAMTFTVDGADQAVSISSAEILAATGGGTGVTGDKMRELLASKLTGVTVSGSGSAVTITSNTKGATSGVALKAGASVGSAASSTATTTTLGINAAVPGTTGTALVPGVKGSNTVTWGGSAIEVNKDAKISFDATIDGKAQKIEITQDDVLKAGNGDSTIDSADEYATILASKITGTTAAASGNTITLTSATSGTSSAVALGAATVTGINFNADELVKSINDNAFLKGNIRGSNDNGKLRVENLSTQKLNISGASGGKTTGVPTSTSDVEGNSVRTGLAAQFNELRDQLDKLADDASFNGINLLRGDNLAITFNETGTSSIDIQTKEGRTINSANLGVATTIEAKDLDSDTNIDAELTKLKTALNDVRSQASSFGSNLSIVQGRQDFTNSMIATLKDGAGNLTLADMNSEAANLLALQTRQSLASNSLSLASQQDQSVLQLIR